MKLKTDGPNRRPKEYSLLRGRRGEVYRGAWKFVIKPGIWIDDKSFIRKTFNLGSVSRDRIKETRQDLSSLRDCFLNGGGGYDLQFQELNGVRGFRFMKLGSKDDPAIVRVARTRTLRALKPLIREVKKLERVKPEVLQLPGNKDMRPLLASANQIKGMSQNMIERTEQLALTEEIRAVGLTERKALPLPKTESRRKAPNGTPKFTEEEVRDIRASVGKVSQRELRQRYGASRTTIKNILARRTYKHVV